MAEVTVSGFCDDRFSAVADAFAKNFAVGPDGEALECGASVAITVAGESLVDLWAGDAGPKAEHGAWERDTIVNVYSTTKTMSATCVLMLVDQGLVDLDAPVATYWPEFAQNGKEAVTVAQVMSHTSAVPGFEPNITIQQLYDWDLVCANLAAQAPWWEPGTVSGYHATSQGFLQGEIVRRVTGRTIGTFFAEEVAGPLGADFHIGLDASHDDRVGELIPAGRGFTDGSGDSIPARVGRGVPMDATEPQTRAWRAAELPASGGFGNARSVARVHAALACGGTLDGVRLLSPEIVEQIHTPIISGDDLVLGVPIDFGLGFGIPSKTMPLSKSPRSFFWGGWGGSMSVIDLESQMSFAYVMNRMASGLTGDLRAGTLAVLASMAVAK